MKRQARSWMCLSLLIGTLAGCSGGVALPADARPDGTTVDATLDAPLADAPIDAPLAPDASPPSDVSIFEPDASVPDAALAVPDAPLAPDSAVAPDAPLEPDAAASPDAAVMHDAPVAMPDATTPDAGDPDASAPDASEPDAETPDAGVPDAETPDAGVLDAASPDASTPDATAPDAGGTLFIETFSGGNASSWPAPWVELGGVASDTVTGGRGRLVPTPSNYSLGRMGVSAQTTDVEVTYRVAFEDIGTQGVGFYVRQNSGWLQGTTPHGAGYAVFLEGFRGSRFGVWREVDGVETEITAFTAFGTPLASGTTYAVHFRVEQQGGSTHLRARVWVASEAEPSAWQIDTLDTTASLQNVAGGYAVDSWSTTTQAPLTAGTIVDDITITPL